MKRINIFDDIYRKMDSDENVPSQFPHTIDVELTNKCNLSCSFCNRQFMKRKQGFMTDETFGKILAEIEDIKLPIRFIRWGEPLLHPKVITYANNLTKRGIPLHITTNGLLLDEDMSEKLISVGVDSIIFSMQGTNKKEYESCRVGGYYDILSNNIRTLSKLRGNEEKPYITITATVDGTQGKDKKKFIDYWKRYVDDVRIGITNLSRIDGSVGKHIDCNLPWKKLGIDWDGEVTACCGDYDKLLSIGNINNATLYNIWNGDLMRAYRKIIAHGKLDSLSLCRECYPAYGNFSNNTSKD